MSKLLARNRALFQKGISIQTPNCWSSKLTSFTTTSTPRDEVIPSAFNSAHTFGGLKGNGLFKYTAGTPSAVRRKHTAASREPNSWTPAPQRTIESMEPIQSITQNPETHHNDSDILSLLSKPTWSVRSLLPPKSPTQTITRKELHHLLRLSALPLPKDIAEEEKMLQSLHSQLHFVGDIQSVDTEGVEPLVRIAEETEAGRKEATIGLEDLREVLDKEVVIGRNKRRRRVRDDKSVGKGEDWDVFKTANETVEVPGSGRYFIVRSGKEREKD